MLLRESSRALGDEAELSAIFGNSEDDGGVEHGRLLTSFAEAAVLASPRLEELRGELVETLGAAVLVEAAATIAAFSGLVRIADSTGLPLATEDLRGSAEIRSQLGLDRWPGASRKK